MKKGKRTVVLAVALLALVASGASAATVGLDTLVGGGSITLGNLMFSDFSYIGSGTIPLTAADISVTDLIEGGLPTLRFTGAWSAINTSTSDSLIGYKITVLYPPPISDLHLTLGAVDVGGVAAVSVVETYYDASGAIVADLGVNAFPGSSPADREDAVFLNQTYNSLTVMKDIGLFSVGTGSFAFTSRVDQGYSMVPVPEPGTMLLLGSGLVGLAGWGRKKFRK